MDGLTGYMCNNCWSEQTFSEISGNNPQCSSCGHCHTDIPDDILVIKRNQIKSAVSIKEKWRKAYRGY